MISAISVKDRLKNQAVASGKTFQEALMAYGLERTVYRLSVSEYVERFTLKGGKKYYVKIRTYKIVNGTKHYSPWSKTKTVTTKK